jgi:TolB-like protein/Tfp pilus assembly protein PilF
MGTRKLKPPFSAYQGSDPYIFVCYSHDDSDTIFGELTWLRDEGINVWYDEGIVAGGVWRAEVADAIERAAALVYFVSPRSAASAECSREVHYALDRDVPVIPLFLDTTELPPDLKMGLTRVQALFRNSDANYREHLLSALRGRAPRPAVSSGQAARPGRRFAQAMFAATALAVALVAAWWYLVRERVPDAPVTAIAVLPFDDQSPTGDEGWLANSLTDMIIESLNRIEGIQAPGRHSTMALNDQGAGPRGIGARLHVGSIVAGSVQRIDDELRVVVHWNRVADGPPLPNFRYERPFEDIFTISRDIAREIAEGIRIELDINEVPWMEPGSTNFITRSRYEPNDVRAWELMVRCESKIESYDPADLGDAEQLCLDAIEIDPEYAAAQGQLAMAYFMQAQFGDYTTNVRLAVAAAERALALNPVEIKGNWVLANYHMHRWENRQAEERLNSALAADPHNAFLAMARVILLWRLGRLDEAVVEARRGATLEPLWPAAQAVLGEAYLVAGDLSAALETLEYAQSLGPIQPTARVMLAIAYERSGRAQAALESMISAFPIYETELRQGFAAGGWRGANSALAEAMPIDACPASVHALAGEREELYECLEVLLLQKDRRLPEFLISPAFAAFRQQPRFMDIVERMQARMSR